MNIHEKQAKELLQKFGVWTPRGKIASTPDEAEQIARELGDVAEPGQAGLVVKAQIRAGGRGKGTFANGFKGGVHLCKSPAEAREIAGQMLGQTLVTHQTGPAGRVVNKVLVAASAPGDAPDRSGRPGREQGACGSLRGNRARDLFCHSP